MTKRLRRTLGAATALLVGMTMTAAGVAQAGINPQALTRQGINPQGINPQGINPQGINPQGISMDSVALSGLAFSDGEAVLSPHLVGSELRGYKSALVWPYVMLATGAGLVGATFDSEISYENGATSTQHVILTIDAVATDGSQNTMVCDPQDPSLTNCALNYHQNSDVTLYKLSYVVDEPGAPQTSGWLCGGDHMAMLFQGAWGEDGAWTNTSGTITVACTSGVLTKCARSWGYKPWRTMIDMHGNARNMRDYHQACARAARADYAGLGDSFTVTGTPVDLFDDGGFNVPTPPATLTALGYQTSMRFESVFTSRKKTGSIKPDYWGKWMVQPRFDDLPLWEAMYDYPSIDWDDEFPKFGFSATTLPSTVQSDLASQVGYYGAEIAVYNPIWSATGSAVATGSTAESHDHFPPSCAYSNAPDSAYRWVAPQPGTYRITTVGSTYDTVLYVYDQGNEIACNDDSAGLQSSVDVSVAGGQEITIFIDGYGTAKGPYALNIHTR